MKTPENKDLNYYKDNAEENYPTTPISVLRYITELETESASLRQEVERLRGLLNIGDIEIAYIVNDKLNKTANGVRLNDTQRSPIHDGAWILAEHLRNNSNATTHHGKGGTEG